MTDYRRARERMVDEQIVPRGVTDRAVVAAMRKVPRHLFVDEGFRERAYGDHPLPIGEGQTISQPAIVAIMTQALRLLGHEKVLEVGTGSGYQAAVLAEIVQRVFSVERLVGIHRRSRAVLDSLGYHTVMTRVSDGTWGWDDEAPFDAVIVTAGAPSVPERLTRQLAEGGRLVIPVGGSECQTLLRITRTGDTMTREELGGCVFVPLIGKDGWDPGGER
jgi:protein-L-isoaspartate(D-aspartate) O-methyltransferase